ncbi:hypothetical protein COEREDRAFT_88346 [Coemansia reversa NRRL 1564]|uniref:Uncharacterized protein n=1 Tax=Coemansia reversa (strain ATCC 12441 / NRRL 1564) TaxID=763665 RepID=A0A2G5B712_COERN|nr:hypothetical protein COEREDRAFT_88346 [Coemansia reversa NRRL 1564]|eukprot:PIA14816.1 hypothetical protein COEREDRAFT_88346 [Coemansia reversa NRRL 1564]
MNLFSINLFVVTLLCVSLSVIAVPVPLDVLDDVVGAANSMLESDVYTTWSYDKLNSLFTSTTDGDYDEETPSTTEVESSEELTVPIPDYSTTETISSEEQITPTPEFSTIEDATTDIIPRCPHH